MEKRMVRNELVMVRRMAAFLSDMLHWQDDMRQRLELVENGSEELDKLVSDTTALFNKVVKTIPDNQKQSILNSLSDFKITLQPKLTPESQLVMISKSEAKELFDMAQDRCKGCVEDLKHAEKCPVFKLMETNVPLDTYGDGLICPYSVAEWEE